MIYIRRHFARWRQALEQYIRRLCRKVVNGRKQKLLGNSMLPAPGVMALFRKIFVLSTCDRHATLAWRKLNFSMC